jgi:UDP-4-amino-4,6-dideoxy-N-acetyl-beta-L-altrosamine transaminase
MMNKIPYGRQHITEEDIEAVNKVLRSDFLTQGPEIRDFEEAFAEYIGSEYAIAVANGTAALHLCTLALGVIPGQKVITTPVTFVASANCVRYAGGEVIFSDIESDTYLLDPVKVRKLLTEAPPGTYQGIIPVDFAGRPVNMELFRKLADEFGLWIIEDACHAPGGYFTDKSGNRQSCGNGNFAELAIFSFHPVKHIAAGEGGMITTNDKALYDKIRNLRTHGIQQNAELLQRNDGIWYYEMQELGYNYRLTDFQAALGKSQLKRADKGVQRRLEIAEKYASRLADKPYVKRITTPLEGHAFHLYIAEFIKRDELISYLRNKNIVCQVHYIPAHLMPYYRQFGWKEGDMPVAENYYRNCMSLPLFPTLKDEEQEYVLKMIEEFYQYG